jgi:UDP-N-acetylglucosamine 2-epimerase (non-hydrolysing)
MSFCSNRKYERDIPLSTKPTVMVIIGTRPEAVKLAPVVLELQRRPKVQTVVGVTAQHRQMLDQVLGLFHINPAYDLDVMQTGQTVFELTSRMLTGLKDLLEHAKPDIVLVQGDTTTVMVAALAAFYLKIPVGHVEAGLRSFDKYQPFPEEVNRKLTTVLADLHFAPTELARSNLLAEGVEPARIFVTGNTAVDALLRVVALEPDNTDPIWSKLDANRRLIVVTTHRRENWGEPILRVCRALRQIITEFPDVEVLYSLHPNPLVRELAHRELSGTPRILLTDAFEYRTWVQILQRSTLILTDSGGIQEEAPSLGKPVLVLRNVTERPEGVTAGTVKVVGTDEAAIVSETTWLLTDPQAYSSMSHVSNPYGDGHSAARVADALEQYLARAPR